MKRILVILAALFLVAGTALATEAEKNITRKFNVGDFNSISVSGIVQVELKKANRCEVNVTFPRELEDYLSVKVIGGSLKIGTKNIPNSLSRRLNDKSIVAEVSMPVLCSLEMSGATKFSCDDAFNLGKDTFELEMSGSSRAYGLNIDADELDIKMSGATYASISGAFDEVDGEFSGAIQCEMNVTADKLDIEAGGAAKIFTRGRMEEIKIETSGASQFAMEGSTEQLYAEGSGASRIKMQETPVEKAKVSLSGGSSCTVDASKRLTVDISGASSVKYVAHEGLDLDLISVSRASSLSKIK